MVWCSHKYSSVGGYLQHHSSQRLQMKQLPAELGLRLDRVKESLVTVVDLRASIQQLTYISLIHPTPVQVFPSFEDKHEHSTKNNLCVPFFSALMTILSLFVCSEGYSPFFLREASHLDFIFDTS